MSLPFIHEHFLADAVSAHLMDLLWARGWRHFGRHFQRYSIQWDDAMAEQTIQPLRLLLADFRPSRSQRRAASRNADLAWEIIPARADEEVQRLFHEHKTRFRQNIPESLFDFISDHRPDAVPCECLEFRALLDGKLVAASFLDVGAESTSSVYGLFDLRHSRRSLGLATMLKEIEWSLASGKRCYYPGYATKEPSAYDYKKQFAGLQFLDWATSEWQALEEA